MTVRVNDEQDEKNQSSDQQHDDDRLILPNRLHEIGGIGVHSLLIYTHTRQNLIFTARWTTDYIPVLFTFTGQLTEWLPI